MISKHRKQILSRTAAILMAGGLCTPAFASTGGAVPDFRVSAGATGTVQDIDYLHHAITVNGQTYVVTQGARFSGIGGFSVLHIGMPIRYVTGHLNNTADGPQPDLTAPDNSPLVITQITWLPGGA